ncbi:hypothetical protein LAZ67_7001800 [Cordylochernes scorpioides]|uniref:Mos1 transposase HTH domain-containing protein n=1 Tax=Cordylochernes scorpioides TaxID=51811 RepID=A0ABY6KP57_9ARAC|nr:hypothetical protein LAZ67_7001800 [Cordylochernes scorpioides]
MLQLEPITSGSLADSPCRQSQGTQEMRATLNLLFTESLEIGGRYVRGSGVIQELVEDREFCNTLHPVRSQRREFEFVKPCLYLTYCQNFICYMLIFFELRSDKILIISTWRKIEYRAILRYNFDRGLDIEECFQEVTPVLGNDCPHRTNIFRWYREFKRGKYGIRDAPRLGRTASLVNEENIAGVKKLLETNRHITYRQIGHSIHSILHDHLKVTRRVSWCREMLKRFDNRSSRYVNSIITGDETWLYYFYVSTKSQNKVRIFEKESTLVSVRKSRSIKKKMLAVFFTDRRVVSRAVLENQKTVTAKWYTKKCLPKVVQAIKSYVLTQGLTHGFSTMTMLQLTVRWSAPIIWHILD